MSALTRITTSTPAGIALAVIAACSFSTTGFIASQLAGETAPGQVIAFYEAAFGLCFVLGVYGRSVRGVSRASAPWLIATGLALATGFGGFYTALAQVDLSVVAPIAGAVPLVTYGAVLVLLRGTERLTPRTVAGAALVVGGVVLISIVNG
ncbi:MAG: EamA family transporter [Chloroflexota bacterium]